MAVDYSAVGFKCGIEIHQRLATWKKLFCSCPTHNESEDARGEIQRRQRAVAGELGAVDAASMHEQLRNRKFVYRTFPSYCCLVDEDEEPPNLLNGEALQTGLQVAIMLDANVVDEVEIMRKSVLDGSNTGGFQRTALFALNGRLETSQGMISIPTIAVEEEACGIVEDKAGEVVYRLDRLGIPLIEIGTGPEIKSPEHCREVAEKLGLLLRSTGKVQRGIGSIRQDVNVSVSGGARIEIKGAQELDAIPKLVENEVKRQLELLKIRDELRKRFAKEFALLVEDVTRLFAKTEAKLLKNAVGSGGVILAMKLPQFGGLLGRELHEGRRFGTELSDYAKTQGVGGIIHSDEVMEKYGLTNPEINALKALLGVEEKDAWIMVAADGEKARRAIAEAHGRAMQAMKGVPEETRKAVGISTAYMRPLPGGARLYPETDTPPIRISAQMLATAKKNLPEPVEEKQKRLALQLGNEWAARMVRSMNLPVYERLLATKVEPMLIAMTLEETLVALRREGVAVESIPEAKLVELLEAYAKELFVKAAVSEILRELARDSKQKVADIVLTKGLQRLKGKALAEAVRRELGEVKDMKAVMAKFRMRADANDVRSVLS